MNGRHERDSRETAGSDLPARGQGVTMDNAKGKPDRAIGKAKPLPPERPKGYKGEHRG